MFKRFVAVTLSVAASAVALGDVTLSVSIDPASVNGDGVISADVFASVSAGDTWTSGGVRGTTSNGASLRYAVDPNTSATLLTNPGNAGTNPHVTFFNKPRAGDTAGGPDTGAPLARTANGRYNAGRAAAAGRYSPTGDVNQIVASASEVNVAFFASPPESASSPTVSNYIFRVAMNIPAPYSDADVVIWTGSAPSSHPVVLFSSSTDVGAAGTVSASFDNPAVLGINWGMSVVPEPASLALLSLGALALIRRR